MAGSPPRPERGDDKTKVDFEVAIGAHQNALDDLVSANSIFTIAVFVGLGLVAAPSNHGNGDHCIADLTVYRKLVVNEVRSFSFFLLSSLVAKALKTHLYTYLVQRTDVNRKVSRVIRGSMLSISAWGSILGCIFLTLSMVDLIEIRLGKMSCRSTDTLHASGALIALVAVALSIYVFFMMHAVYTTVGQLETNVPDAGKS